MHVNDMSTAELEAALATINAQRDSLTSQAREITRELTIRRTVAEFEAAVSKLPDDVRQRIAPSGIESAEALGKLGG